MDQIVNEQVNITAVYFGKKDMRTFPKRMEWGGETVNFVESGLQFLIKRGQSIIQLFDMSDGSATYRLKHGGDEGDNWTLVAIKPNA